MLLAFGLAGALVQAVAAPPGAVVSGRVLEQGTDAPVSGAQVVLITVPQGPPSGPMPFRSKTATTDELGRFAFGEVEPGRYQLNVQKAGFALPGAGRMAPAPFELKAGDSRNNLAVRLVRGGVIAGRVVDQYGEPLVDARVMVLRRPPVPAAAAARATFTNRLIPGGPGAQTNDLGEFRVHSLAPGEYYVQAAPGFRFGGTLSAQSSPAPGTTLVPTYFPGTSDPSAAQPVLVAAGQTTGDIEVRMLVAAAFQVSGVVVDEAGVPVQGAMVRLTLQDPGAPMPPTPMMSGLNQDRTDAAGAFSLVSVTNGAYTLIAIPPVVIQAGPGGTTGGFSSVSSGFVGVAGGVTTESRNGTTVQFRDDNGARVPVTVNEGSVTGLRVVVPRPSAR